MSLIDKIRKESEMPTVLVEKREDGLLEQISVETKEQETQYEESFEGKLLAELEKIPQVSNKKVGVRLEEEVLSKIQDLCRDNNVTVETLLEAFYETCSNKESVMKAVIKEAQARNKRRTRAGNIRSTLTKFRNLQKFS